MGILNYVDTVIVGTPRYTLTHQDSTTEEVGIDLANTIQTTGTLQNKALFDKIEKYLVPVGTIVLWSGTTSNIPTGWALCNGSNGTPDLRNRFIVGAGSTYNVGATGGEVSHTLTTEELPSHTHNIYSSSTGGINHYVFKAGSDFLNANNSIKSLASSHTGLVETGGGQPHENRPPYYALCYIMKLSN